MNQKRLPVKKIIEENRVVYDDYYRSGIIDGWEDQDKSYNFSHLFKIADKSHHSLQSASVLDVGCGTGDILPYLFQKKIAEYVGVDIYKPAITLAKEKFPHEVFLQKDILEYRGLGKFDFVFCSGALSVKLKAIDNYEHLEKMVKRMWEMCNYGVAFNVLTDEDVAPAKHLFYYSIDAVRAICKQAAPDAIVRMRRTPIKNKGYEDESQIHVYLFKKNRKF